jgi:hypothetical protein
MIDGNQLTELGDETAGRLLAARRESLESLVADWNPEGEDPRLDAAIERLAEELASDAPVAV